MQPNASSPPADPLATVDRLAPMLAAAEAESEAAFRLPQPVTDALAQAGLYTMLVPRALNGLETAPRVYVQAIERLARTDSAAAWCCFISNTSALVGGWLPAPVAAALFARPALKMAGVFAPRGRARRAERDGVAGFVVSGTWTWGSGAANADAITAGCLVVGADGKPEADAAGAPRLCSVLLDAAQVRVHDNWRALGLRGTGSGEFSIDGAFVPASHAVTLTEPPRRDEPLYRFPLFGLLGLGIASVALGVARRAIDSLIALSHDKVPQGSRRVLAERAATQAEVARAHARWRAARAFLLEAVDEAWADATAPAPIALERRRDLRLATTHATDEAAKVVDAMFHAAGGHAVFDASPLQRCLRDVHVATQHMMVADATYELAGRLLLGLPTDTAML